MLNATRSADVQAGPRRVFRCLVDPAYTRQWWPALQETVLTSGDLSRPGSTFVRQFRFRNDLADYRGEVLACEPPHTYGFSLARDDFYMRLGFQLRPAPGGTQVVVDCDIDSSGRLARLAGLATLWVMRRELDDRLAALKALAEAP